MKECVILGVKTYSDPSYIFSGVRIPQPHDLRPLDHAAIHGRRVTHVIGLLHSSVFRIFSITFRRLKLVFNRHYALCSKCQ